MENVKLLLRCGMSGRSVKMPKTASAPFRTLPTSHNFNYESKLQNDK